MWGMKQTNTAGKIILVGILTVVAMALLSAFAVGGFFILWLLYPSPVAH
jgi:hypothetical protein